MFLRMITYDSEYGDASVFDDHNFATETYDELISSVLGRFDWLMKNRILIVDREAGFANVVEPRSGKTAESYLVAYPSEHDVLEGINGLELANSIFYDPDTRMISCDIDAYSFMDFLSDREDEVFEAWDLGDLLQNPPPQLGGNNGSVSPLHGLELTKFLFELYRSRLVNN